MTPRSLVGMTMRARKRCGADYLHALTINRLGKRLRPCPGCAECAYITFVGGRPVRNDKHICDGSGVLPAKKAKVKQWATI